MTSGARPGIQDVVDEVKAKVMAIENKPVAAAYVGAGQGLTLVHFSAQLKRFLWDRGCIEGLLRGCFAGVQVESGGVGGCWGVRVYFVSETAQVELKSGRV